MINKIEIIDEFLSDELCDYFINYFEKNESLRRTHKVNNGNLLDIDITRYKEFSELFDKINLINIGKTAFTEPTYPLHFRQ